MNEYQALWAAWFAGPVDNDMLLWGYPLWVWARIGTVAQFFAVVGLVLELVGYERLRNHALTLQEASLFRWISRYDATRAPKTPLDELREMRGELRKLRTQFPGFKWVAVLVFQLVFWGSLLGGTFIATMPSPFFEEMVFGSPPYGPVVTWLRGLQEMQWFATLSAWAWGLLVFSLVAVFIYRVLIQILLLPFRIVRALSGVLSLPRLKMILNTAIVLATAFNVHFTLLTQ
jgi:hypothetical protein